MLVCALVLAVGLIAVMGILYNDFDGQMREELSKEALYLAYGVDQQGVDYLKNIKDRIGIDVTIVVRVILIHTPTRVRPSITFATTLFSQF